jgi:hypothetical protein
MNELKPLADRFEQAALVFETTTSSQERRNAEQFLLAFQDSPSPYQVCFCILTTSKLETAKMQAATVFISAVAREWPSFPPGRGVELRNMILHCLTTTALSEMVKRQWFHVAALLFKRAWLTDERTAEYFLTQFGQIMDAPNRALMADGLVFADQVTGQLQSRRATALGLSWEYHVKCHREFETKTLGPMFTRLGNVLREFVDDGGTAKLEVIVSQPLVLKNTLTLIAKILEWEFRSDFATDGKLALRSLSDNPLLDHLETPSIVTPGSAWTPVLVDSPLLELLFGLEAALSSQDAHLTTLHTVHMGAYSARQVSPLSVNLLRDTLLAAASASRKALLHLFSLKGAVFTAEPKRLEFFARAMRGLSLAVARAAQFPALGEAALAAGLGEQLLDVAQMAQRLLGSLHADGLLAIEAYACSLSSSFLSHVCALSVNSLADGYTNSVDTCLSEAFDVLVEAWGALVTDCDLLAPHKRLPATQLLARCCPALFAAYTERRLHFATLEVLSGEERQEQFDEAYLFDQLQGIALLARVDCTAALGLLSAQTGERLVVLERPGSAEARTVAQEHLFWLLHLLANVLCDPPAGSTPTIPTVVMACSAAASSHQADPVLLASRVLFQAAQIHLTALESFTSRTGFVGAKPAVLSPLLFKVLANVLARWAATFLCPVEALHASISPHIWASFGEDTDGARTHLEFLLRFAGVTLGAWPEEEDVGEAACALLHTLVQSRKICPHLADLQSWQMLLSSFEGNVFAALPRSSLAGLAQALTLVIGESKSANSTAKQQLFARVGGKLQSALELALRQPCFRSPQAPDATSLETILGALHGLLGVARAGQRKTYQIVFPFCAPLLPTLTNLLPLCGGRDDESCVDVVRVVVQIFSALAEYHLTFLPATVAAGFMQASLAFVQLYTVVNATRLTSFRADSGIILKRSKTGSKGSGDGKVDKDEGQYEDLNALLGLLSHITDKDMFDLSEDSQESKAPVMQTATECVLVALRSLCPVLSARVLLFPELAVAYLDLMATILQTHPEHVAGLPANCLEAVLTTVVAAVRQPYTGELGLRILKVVANHHLGVWNAPASKRNTLSPQELQELERLHQFLNQCLEQLMMVLLLEPLSASLIEPLADALFPLILACYPCFESLVKSYIGNQPAEEIRNRLTRAFNLLISENGLTRENTRPNRANFRKNVTHFLQEVRSFMTRTRDT